jgi:hypothetical protein
LEKRGGAEEEQIMSRREQRTGRGNGRSSSRKAEESIEGAEEEQLGGEEKQWRSREEERRSSAGEEVSIEGAEEEQRRSSGGARGSRGVAEGSR